MTPPNAPRRSSTEAFHRAAPLGKVRPLSIIHEVPMPPAKSRLLALSSAAFFAALWTSTTLGPTACTSETSDGTADTTPSGDTGDTDHSGLDTDTAEAPETADDSDAAQDILDTEVPTPDIEPLPACWPNYDKARCEPSGWTWHPDYSTHYCPNPGENCPPPSDESFCALPCDDDADCEGTTVPFCGRIGYWDGGDAYGCSLFKVCVPFASSYEWDCYRPRPAELCPR